MDNLIITVATAVFASTGFWAFVAGFFYRKSAQKELLVGLAHDTTAHKFYTCINGEWVEE